MLNFKKVVLPTILATSILVPSAVYASAINSANTQPSVKYEDCNGHNKNHGYIGKELKEVEKYVPGAEEQVKQVLTERRELSRQLRELNAKKLGVDISFMNDFKKIAEDTHRKVENGELTKEAAEKYLEEQKKKFETDHAAELSKFKQAKKDYTAANEDEIKAKKETMKGDMKKIKEANNALKEAVQLGDAAKVKDTYNKYLNALKLSNQLLKNEVNKLNS